MFYVSPELKGRAGTNLRESLLDAQRDSHFLIVGGYSESEAASVLTSSLDSLSLEGESLHGLQLIFLGSGSHIADLRSAAERMGARFEYVVY